MALVKRFEDLQAWQEARRLVNAVYELTCERQVRRDWALVDQLRRAAISAMINIAEGFDSGSTTEFRRFLRYSVRSSSEVQSSLYVALDRGYVDQARFDAVYESANRTKALCSALIRRLTARNRHRDGHGYVGEQAAPWSNALRPLPTHVRTSAHQNVRTSARQHVGTSTRQHVRTPARCL